MQISTKDLVLVYIAALGLGFMIGATVSLKFLCGV